MNTFTNKLKKTLVFETKRHIISKYYTFGKTDDMPISKNARKRFILIDGILKSHKRYSIKEIAEKVNEQLDEDGFAMVSERMIYNDIQMKTKKNLIDYSKYIFLYVPIMFWIASRAIYFNHSDGFFQLYIARAIESVSNHENF